MARLLIDAGTRLGDTDRALGADGWIILLQRLPASVTISIDTDGLTQLLLDAGMTEAEV